MIFINIFMKATFKEKIAMILFLIGIEPKSTMFIDEATVSRGYGKVDSNGIWEYQIPFILTQPEEVE